MVRLTGFAPATSAPRTRRSTKLSYSLFFKLVAMKNLMLVYAQADEEDKRVAEASWKTYNVLTTQIAHETGHDPDIAAAVFAALSPNNDYYGNLRDTRRLLEAHRDDKTVDGFKVSTYGHNKRKAWRIVEGEKPLDLIRAPKTRNFYLNIRDPNDPRPVTVDGHIFNAWNGERIPLKGAAQKINAKIYEIVAEDIRTIGKVTGTLPCVTQGIIWYTWRRIHNIKFTRQQELWSPEGRAAGVEVPYWQSICDS